MKITVRKVEATDSSALNILWQFYQYHQSLFDLEDVVFDGRFDVDEEYLGSLVRG